MDEEKIAQLESRISHLEFNIDKLVEAINDQSEAFSSMYNKLKSDVEYLFVRTGSNE